MTQATLRTPILQNIYEQLLPPWKAYCKLLRYNLATQTKFCDMSKKYELYLAILNYYKIQKILDRLEKDSVKGINVFT